MNKKIFFTTTLFLLTLLAGKAQVTYSVELLDTLKLELASIPTGTIQWQKSVNQTDWENITGATTNPYNFVVVSVPVYFRAKIITSTCDDYTEILTVNDSTETGYTEESIVDINETPELVPIYYNTIPSQKILSMPPVKNQGAQGSCSAWAVTYYLMSYLKNEAEGVGYLLSGVANDAVLCSPAFTFNQIKLADSDDDCSGSGAIQHLIKLKSQGACSLKDMPYKAKDCETQPNSTQISAASQNRISQYFKVDRDNVQLVKTVLALGKPLVLAISADYAFKNLTSPYQWTSGTSGSGHSVTLAGYSDASGGFRFVNSWGKSWGDNGYFYMSYPDFQELPNGKYCYTAFWKSNPIYNNLDNQLTHHYPLNGTAANLKGTSATATNTTATTNRKGQATTALLFDGSSSFVEANENLNTASFSFSLWFNTSNNTTGTQTVFSQVNKQTDANKGLELYINNKYLTLDVPIDTGRYTLVTADTIVPGRWYHIAVTYDGGFLRFYVNGTPIKIGIYTQFFNTSDNKLTLACQKANSTGVKAHFFAGKIDEFRVYNRNINDAEVNELFNE